MLKSGVTFVRRCVRDDKLLSLLSQMNLMSILRKEKDKTLLLLHLMLCRVAANQISPYIANSADYINLFGPMRSVEIL